VSAWVGYYWDRCQIFPVTDQSVPRSHICFEWRNVSFRRVCEIILEGRLAPFWVSQRMYCLPDREGATAPAWWQTCQLLHSLQLHNRLRNLSSYTVDWKENECHFLPHNSNSWPRARNRIKKHSFACAGCSVIKVSIEIC